MASKSSIEAGRAHVSLGTDASALEKGLDAASAKFKAWGKGIMSLGAGITAAAALITAPFLYGLSVFSDWGKEVTTASRETGIGFEAVQGISIALRTDLDGLVHSVGHMNSFLGELAHGSAEAARELRDLGLDAGELLGDMSEEDRVRKFAEAIASIGDAAERGAAARKIFGRGAIHMDFSGGVEGMRAREARGREVGGVLSASDQAGVMAYNRALKEMELATRGLWASFGAAAAPAMTEFFQFVTGILIATRKWTEENRHLLDVIFRIADKVGLAGLVITAFATVIYGVSYAIAFFKIALILKTAALLIASAATLAYSVATTVGTAALALFTTAEYAAAAPAIALAVGILVIVAAVVAMVAIVYVAIAGWDSFASYMSAWGPIFTSNFATIKEAFMGIGDAISANEWGLAMEIATTGLKILWLRFAAWFYDSVQSFKYMFFEVWDAIRDYAASAITAIVNAMAGPLGMLGRLVDIDVGALTANALAIRADPADQAARQANQQAVAGAFATQIAGAQDDLKLLAAIASISAGMAEVAREMDAEKKAGGFKNEDEKGMVLGGFSAQGAFGVLGATSKAEDPIQALIRVQEAQLAVARGDQKLLREILNRVAPQFG